MWDGLRQKKPQDLRNSDKEIEDSDSPRPFGSFSDATSGPIHWIMFRVGGFILNPVSGGTPSILILSIG